MNRKWMAWGVGVAIMMGCASEKPAQFEEPARDTGDLPAAMDHDPDTDPRAPSQRARLGGVLPSDFPNDLPVLLPASVVDFGEGGGQSWVAFETRLPPATVVSRLHGQLGSAGWEGGVTVGASTLRKADRSLEVTVESANEGSRYQYCY